MKRKRKTKEETTTNEKKLRAQLQKILSLVERESRRYSQQLMECSH